VPRPSLLPRSGRALAAIVTVACLLPAGSALALLHIDFEQPYYVHPGMQVWDFCLIQDQGTYHIFYHGIPMDAPQAINAETIFRSSSEDLIHWSAPVAVLTTSDAPWESNAIWAPDVVRDPDTGRWWMAYTAVDDQRNQRIAVAWSEDLITWEKVPENPVYEPDPILFFYDPAAGGAECRDPFLYQRDGLWHLVVTAKLHGTVGGRGALVQATSQDLIHWSPGEPLLANDGESPYNSLESGQYLEMPDGADHVFFHEHSTIGISHIGAFDPADWTLDDRIVLDLGIAPEIDSFDGGQTHLFSRIAPYQEPQETALSYVTRIDTLAFRTGEAPPTLERFPPLARDFATFTGNICLGNPIFGDNPARRGEEPVGLVGNGYFGSREYFQGPLSGRGDAGRELGLTATGYLESYPFVIEGNAITMLLGGTANAQECYVALMDAATDSLLRRATGHDGDTMRPRGWDVSELQGREVYLRIEDSDFYGHICVDEIRETMDVVTSVPTTPETTPLLNDHGPGPNPFNPSTTLRFDLAAPARVQAEIHDLRGRLVWRSVPLAAGAGRGQIVWRGVGRDGQGVGAGVYVYRLLVNGRPAASGKLSLVP
jgi:hypothetical protein